MRPFYQALHATVHDPAVALDKNDVLQIAALARLELSEAETERMLADLAKILEYVELLSSLDTADVPPTSHVSVQRAPLRADLREAGIDHERALSEAPRQAADGFAVPGFMED
jgi:aspartyl-tRNA(Asn)/glutamyl-tRNA(Gln) amidotransferase subunit C